MGMHNRFDIGPHFVNQQMHRDLARGLRSPRSLLPLISITIMSSAFAKPFIAAGRRAHDAAIGQPRTDVPILRRNKLLLVDEMTESFDFSRGIH
jgi:hypothetical protein